MVVSAILSFILFKIAKKSKKYKNIQNKKGKRVGDVEYIYVINIFRGGKVPSRGKSTTKKGGE